MIDDETPLPAVASGGDAPSGPGGWGRALVAHLVAAMLAATAIFFVAWFLCTNTGLLQILASQDRAGAWHFLPGLTQPWAVADGSMDYRGLFWGLATVALVLVIGWFYLEGLELYLPRGAMAALAYLFGLGLIGLALEWLAIPFWLGRASIALAIGALLAILAARVWRRARKPPASGLGGGASAQEHLMRRSLAAAAWRDSLVRPRGLLGWAFAALALGLIAAITFFIFWHALLYPEVYWDSMILYVGYARMTYLQGGFPIKVVGQVGIGLGANYPHLYAVLGAGVATASGAWSELPQRLLAPLAGLASTVLVYHTAARLTRHVNFSLAIALLYRSIPYAICYDQYASDYALALLFAAAFLYLALLYIGTALPGYLAAATLLIALSMHLNYLMGILWAPWLAMLVLAHSGRMRGERTARAGAAAADAAPWAALARRSGIAELLRSGGFWLMLLASCALGSTWYVRNWIVTGNPVYAFFPQIFGYYHINPDVMAAAAAEWMNNGAGIGLYGETFARRLAGTWGYFVTDTKYAFRVEPIMAAFSLGGLIVWLARCLAAPFARAGADARRDLGPRFGLIVALLALALLAFHFTIAPFYLYQIIKLLPCLALLAALAWPWWRLAPWRHCFGALALAVGVVPGVTMGMMGFKITHAFQPSGGAAPEGPLSLYVLRHPLPAASRFYRWQYGSEALMWDYINDPQNLILGQKLLTHENRDLALDPSIEIVNLDDWKEQALWPLTDDERVRRLVQDLGIHYYLRVPNEDNCATNARMGTANWPRLGLATPVHQEGVKNQDGDTLDVLYRLNWPPVGPGSSDAATSMTSSISASRSASALTAQARSRGR